MPLNITGVSTKVHATIPMTDLERIERVRRQTGAISRSSVIAALIADALDRHEAAMKRRRA